MEMLEKEMLGKTVSQMTTIDVRNAIFKFTLVLLLLMYLCEGHVKCAGTQLALPVASFKLSKAASDKKAPSHSRKGLTDVRVS